MEMTDISSYMLKKNVFLYFYPWDGTPGCTSETIGFSDREKEFLLPTDIAIVRSRRRLLEYVKSEESLAKFREIVKDGSAYAVVPLDVVSELGEMDEFLERHHGELMPGDTAEPAAA